MKKCKLETKVERLNLTLTSNTFTLSKHQDLVLMLSDDDLAIVSKNTFIKVTLLDKKKSQIKLEKKEDVKEVVNEIKKEVKENAEKQQVKAKDLLKTNNNNNKKNRNNKKNK